MNNRLHGMDFSRAVLMCLGIFYHCGLIYGTEMDWRVLSTETAASLTAISNVIHDFRMESFYLISGFFYYLIYKKERGNFLSERVLRALIPMCVIGFSLNFAMNYYSYNRSFHSDWKYFATGQWLGHLWFLGNLIIYFVVSTKVCKFISVKNKKINANFYFWVFVCVCIALCGKLFAYYIFDRTVGFIHFSTLFYYYGFFLIGILCFSSKEKFYSLIKVKKIPSYLLFYVIIQWAGNSLSDYDTVSKILMHLSHLPLALTVLSALQYIGNRDSKIIRIFSNSSYTVYLLHQPLIIILYYYIFEGITLGVYSEYFLLSFIVFFLSLAFHIYVVERYSVFKIAFSGSLKSLNKASQSEVVGR